jgi:hypothetical protein
MKVLLTFILIAINVNSFAQPNITGAWQAGTHENRMVMIVADKFYSVAVYNQKDKTYISTYGGTYRIEKDEFIFVNEFNTMNKENIGVESRSDFQLKDNVLKLATHEFKKLDDGKPGALSGAWLITGRVTGNGMETITPSARKTMKILSGTRFQWIAYNSETKEFFGTGGGTYTTVDGKYTEAIEVFSRDNNRVGAKLEFDFSFVEGAWQHSGKSSSGEPIDEIWTQRQKLGI